MKNPFRSLGAPAPPSAPSPSPVPSRWPSSRAGLLGTILILTAAFLALDLWTWRQTAARQAEDLARTYRTIESLRAQVRAAREERDQTREERDRTRTALDRSRSEQKRLDERVRELEREHRKVSETQQRFEKEMRAALESRDVTISELAGKITVNILDQFPDRQIQVIGHTDNVPIHTTRYASNWELSAARALAAVRFLAEQAGVDATRLGALAYGEFHPIADNSTPEGRAQNRRIAIVVLPEIVAVEAGSRPADPADTVPARPSSAAEP